MSLLRYDSYAASGAAPTPSEPRCISRALVLHLPFALQTDHAALQD